MPSTRSDRQAFPAGDPEWFLICRVVVDYAESRTTSVEGVIDWSRLLALGERHCIGPLLATQLLRDGATPHIPEWVRKELVTAKQQNLEQVLRMVAELRKLELLLSAAGIDYRILKGLPLAALAYHDVMDRHAGDIDLLLMNPAAIQLLHDLLLANGYRVKSAHAQYDSKLQGLYFRLNKANAYTTPDGALLLETHWPSTFVPAFPNSLLTALEHGNSAVVECLGQRFQQPAVAELCSYLVWHGARAQWYRLKWLADVYLLARQTAIPATCLDEQAVDATSWRLGLQLLRRLFHYDPGFACPAPEAWLEATCLDALRTPSGLPGVRRLRASLALRRGWSWYKSVLLQHAIKLSDYQGFSWPVWAVYVTLPVVRPVSLLYRSLMKSRVS